MSLYVKFMTHFLIYVKSYFLVLAYDEAISFLTCLWILFLFYLLSIISSSFMQFLYFPWKH